MTKEKLEGLMREKMRMGAEYSRASDARIAATGRDAPELVDLDIIVRQTMMTSIKADKAYNDALDEFMSAGVP